MDRLKKPLYMAAGFLALLLGAIGVVLPLLPTTPFVILAAFFFSKGSHKIHHWLLAQKTFGPMIQAWEQDRIIPLKAKLISTSMMLVMVSYPLLFRPFALWLKVFVVFTVFYGLWYVWRHRSEPLQVAVERSWQLSQKEAGRNRVKPQQHQKPKGAKKPAPVNWEPAHVVVLSRAE